QPFFAQPALHLRTRRERVQTGPKLHLDGLELDLADFQLPRPGGNAAEQHSDSRVAGELGELCRRHRSDAVAAVVEDEPLFTRNAMAAQPQADLLRERFDHFGIAHRRRRAEHQRSRAGDVAARVRIRPADVADDEVRLAQPLPRPSTRSRARSTACSGASSSSSFGRWFSQSASAPPFSIKAMVSARPARRSGESPSARAPISARARTRSGARLVIASAAYPPSEAPTRTSSPSCSSSKEAAQSSSDSPRPYKRGVETS